VTGVPHRNRHLARLLSCGLITNSRTGQSAAHIASLLLRIRFEHYLLQLCSVASHRGEAGLEFDYTADAIFHHSFARTPLPPDDLINAHWLAFSNSLSAH